MQRDKQSIEITLVGFCFTAINSRPREKLDSTRSTSLGINIENTGSGFHRLPSDIYQSKGERGKAIEHSEAAIGFWAHPSLAKPFCDEGELDNSQPDIEQDESHAVDDAYRLGCAMDHQAQIWY